MIVVPRIRAFVRWSGALAAAGFLVCATTAQDTRPARPADTTQPAKPTTLDNLQAAFSAEVNANARYLAFAKKADAEGYAGVASLFRAAARSESVHAENHAKAIKKLGAAPKATLETPAVKSTRENLEAALKGESDERDTMYPEFLKLARADKNTDAITSFNYALAAETEHARLLRDALDHLDAWKPAKRDFLVCLVCGHTTLKLDLVSCPVCFHPREKFEQVN